MVEISYLINCRVVHDGKHITRQMVTKVVTVGGLTTGEIYYGNAVLVVETRQPPQSGGIWTVVGPSGSGEESN